MTQVTVSGLTVSVKLRVLSCNSWSVAVILKLYVVGLAVDTAVPVIVPFAFNVAPVGNVPDANR